MSASQLDAMRVFLARQGGHLDLEVLHGELAVIAASTAVETIGTGRFSADIARLQADAESLLQHALDGLPEPAADAAANTNPAGNPPAERQKLERDQAEAALRDTLTLLEGAGFHPFMLSGTLLRAVREGRIRAHDYDIDLGLLAEEADLAQLEQILA